MANDVTPALTPEQWREVRSYAEWNDGPIDSAVGDTDEIRFYLVALNNHYLADGDSRKFVRRDVRELEIIAGLMERTWGAQQLRGMRSIITRIAALLPDE